MLKLSAQGLPQSWISLEQAVLHYACDQVRWEAGVEVAVFRGGHNAMTGEQSVITVNSIIGTKGVPNINPFDLKPGLTNGKLFARDRNIPTSCSAVRWPSTTCEPCTSTCSPSVPAWRRTDAGSKTRLFRRTW